MKRLVTALAAGVVAIAMSPMASAQGKHGKGEANANPHGQRGIENAETKQSTDHDKDKDKPKKHKKHKGNAKGKQK